MSVATRETVDKALAAGNHPFALAELKRLFHASPTLAHAQFVLDRITRIASNVPSLSCRLYLLRSYTLEPVVPLLRAMAALHAVDVSVAVSDFNTYAQEMLDPNSPLYRFGADIAILAVQTRDLIPALWNLEGPIDSGEVQHLLDEAYQTLQSLIRSFRAHSDAHLVLSNFEIPAYPALGILDAQHASSQAEAIQRLNQSLTLLAKEFPGVYIHDYDGLVARIGRLRWHDEHKWLTVRLPIAAENLSFLANDYSRFLLPLCGRINKAVVVDLDNTLWGGVIGEDGLNGIQIGGEYPGAAYLALQRALLRLHHRGIMLAIASKNNPDEALAALRDHPAMLLRPHHFSALRINWDDKAANLRLIASDLNIGVDSLAFLDDNPVERQRIQTALPEVNVIDLPADPMGYADAIYRCPFFERTALSEEDRARSSYYTAEKTRSKLCQQSASLEEFYKSLEMEVEIAPLQRSTVRRVAQLTQKTNQFNLTTRRYNDQQIETIGASPDSAIYTLRVQDRFGDNGIVGVAILHLREKTAEIDTFLLSCRVIGRTIETAFLSFLGAESRRRGKTILQGWYVPTAKNAPAKDFYGSHHFIQPRPNEDPSLWEIQLTATDLPCPPWIKLRVNNSDHPG